MDLTDFMPHRTTTAAAGGFAPANTACLQIPTPRETIAAGTGGATAATRTESIEPRRRGYSENAMIATSPDSASRYACSKTASSGSSVSTPIRSSSASA